MHCPVASYHIIPKHVRSVHAEHNLWPLGRIRQEVFSRWGNTREGAGQRTGRVVLEGVAGLTGG